MPSNSESATAPARGGFCWSDTGSLATSVTNIALTSSTALCAAYSPRRASFIAPVSVGTVDMCRDAPSS
jgi:hypothetical protein